MIIICWHSLGFLINFRQPQDNSYLFEESTFATRSKVCANCTWVWRKNDGLQKFDQKSNAGVRKGVFPVLSL